MEIWARVCFWGLRHIVGLDFEVRGRENLPAGPAIFAVKHMSMWETIAQTLAAGSCDRHEARIADGSVLWLVCAQVRDDGHRPPRPCGSAAEHDPLSASGLQRDDRS
jgi:hypothetical protein